MVQKEADATVMHDQFGEGQRLFLKKTQAL